MADNEKTVVREIKVPLRGKAGEVTVNLDNLSDDTYMAVMAAGLEALVNKVGMSKIAPGFTKLEGAEKEERATKIIEQAEKNVQELYKGTLRGLKAKSSQPKGAVHTEAMRLAKAVAKDELRKKGIKISALKAAQLTAVAKQVLEAMPQLYEKARANLEERSHTAAQGIDLGKLGINADDPELKAKPKTPPKGRAKKGEATAPLSAAQAGKVQPRAKPQATAH